MDVTLHLSWREFDAVSHSIMVAAMRYRTSAMELKMKGEYRRAEQACSMAHELETVVAKFQVAGDQRRKS